jgi:serine protease
VNDCVNTITHSGDPMDDESHGTRVASTIGAVGNNAVGLTGINWSTAILARGFLDSTGNGTDADEIACLHYIALKKDSGVNIVATKNSWGADHYSQALHDAIVAQRTRGILFLAAAGNSDPVGDNDRMPIYSLLLICRNVICVEASSTNITSSVAVGDLDADGEPGSEGSGGFSSCGGGTGGGGHGGGGGLDLLSLAGLASIAVARRALRMHPKRDRRLRSGGADKPTLLAC